MLDTAWQAQWIWNEGEASPRNEWRCFRKTFDSPHIGWDQANIKVTADSRYVLFINGHRLGRGPVRSWPFEQSYDTYDIDHLLYKDKKNTIAVLVQHFGVSTFYYIRGRGGLLAQLDFKAGHDQVYTLPSDSTWKTSKHLGQHSRSPRMSCQQSFSEFVDASLWDDAWLQASYDDSDWENAFQIGPVGTEPWSKLKKRDIPMLTEETIYPLRVESLNQVKSFTWSTAIDLRNHMVAGSDEHSNVVGFTGYITTILHSAMTTQAILGFTNSAECFGACTLNGVPIPPDEFYGVQPERYVRVQLNQGDNLFVLNVTSKGVHTGILHMGLYCETCIEFRSPITPATNSESPFLTIGPFDTGVFIDHQEERPLDLENKEYLGVIDNVKSPADLELYKPWIRGINPALISESDVLSLCIWKQQSIRLNIPASLQNMVIPHIESASIPIFAGYDTEMVVDFGKEYSGYLSFEIEAEEGVILDLYGFEYMNADYRQDTFGLDNTLRYVCKKGRQQYISPIRRGLRYLMVTVRNASVPLKIFEIKMLQSNYPIAEIGTFQCSDALLNDIWQISQHTTRLCMEDTFVDCPAFEQVFWVGDSRNEALVSNYLYGVNDIVKRCLRLVPGSKDQTPLYADQVPSGWSSVIPNWTFFWAIACFEYYKQTADRAFAQEMYPHIKYTLHHYLAKINEDGLFDIKGWNLLDWSPIDQPNEGIVTHQNLFLVKTLLIAANMATLADDSVGNANFSKAAQQLKTAINKHLWSEEKQVYIDCIHSNGLRSTITSMQTQVVALLTGVAEGNRKARIQQYLINPPQHFVQIGSPFMSFFYYEALAELGESQLIVDDILKNYGQMIEAGATTCWEMYPNFAENRANPDMLTRSHCHAWSSAPAYFLPTELLGVRHTSPGWKEVTIAPKLCGLTWAKGSVPLPEQGRIDISWRVDEVNQTFKLNLQYPKSIVVKILPPDGYSVELKVIEI
jgi:alpha-L-rhamnosidase